MTYAGRIHIHAFGTCLSAQAMEMRGIMYGDIQILLKENAAMSIFLLGVDSMANKKFTSMMHTMHLFSF